MFTISGEQGELDFLLLPPALGTVIDGPALEDVLFLRDEMAEMGWAVERTLQGPMDTPIDGYESYQQWLAQNAPPGPGVGAAGGPDIYYLVGSTVPENWIPLVPVRTPDHSLLFRRGLMQHPDRNGQLVDVPARGQVLEPQHPLFVADQSVSRAGAEVSRYFRRTRWIDGATHTWIGRKSRPGRGPGWSGLAFDLIEPGGQEPSEVGGEGPGA